METSVSPQQAAAELIRRRNARRDLLEFTTYTFPLYTPSSHHRRIVEKLAAVERGEIKRLLVSLPPRGGKSELVSRRFPAWILGRKPGFEIITSSYNSEFASDFGKDVRAILQSDEYGKLFPECRIAHGFGAMDNWQTTTGCKYRAVGVEGSATGRGADGFLVDDPVKDRAEADSELRQRRTWDWYRSTAYTRLSKDAWIIICQTRWNENDLSGKVEEQESLGGEHWDKLIVPAYDERGESFWSDRFPIERLEAIRQVLGPREWSALYMQKPQPDEGGYFQRDWLKSWIDKPERLSVYGTSDYAVTDGAGDWTVHRLWGVDPSGRLSRLGGWRGQTTSDVWIERLCDLIETHKPITWFGEAGVIAKSIEPMLKRRMRERNVRCRLEWLPSINDKPTRARGFQARASMGEVRFEPGADIGEFLMFPAGKHDDEVDCASMMGRALDMAHPALEAPKVVKPTADMWGRPSNEGRDWRVA